MDTGSAREDFESRAGRGPFEELLQAVDFPDFVADLVEGVFNAVVDASVQQMEAYAELLDTAAAAVGEFVQDNVPDSGRDCLDGLFSTGAKG